MKLWSAIHIKLVMALNLIYSDKKINYLHNGFIHVETTRYKIHLSTTPTSAILNITDLKRKTKSPYSDIMVAQLTTIIYDDQEESITDTAKKVLLKIKPLLDED